MASRSERVKALLTRVFEEQGAIDSVNELRDAAMDAEEDEENKLNPTYNEVRAFLGDKGRSQVYKKVKQEWPSRIRKPLKPGVHFVIDGLDWRTRTPKREQAGFDKQKGYKFILCMIDRATRKLYVEPLKTKTAEETRDAVLKMLEKAEATKTIKEMSMDSASEFLSAEMRAMLQKLGPRELDGYPTNEDGVVTHVKPPGRESRQDIADLDAKMGNFGKKLTLIRKKAIPKTLAWLPFVEEAVEFVNKKSIRFGRAMGIPPNKAEASFKTAKEGMEPTEKAVSAFVLQARAAEDREHNRKIQNKARDTLQDPENMKFRPRIPPRAGALKEYREQDPKWLDTVYEVESFRGGQVLGKPAYKEGRTIPFKATKVQPVNKNSQDTDFTDIAVFKDVSRYEDARVNLRPWAILAVKHLETQPGMTGRVREIDRALGLHKAEPMAEFTKWLGKSKQLPLGLYEIFPEFFDIKEETTKEKQGEGSAITLKQERPPTIGEKVANWDGMSKGEAKIVEEKKSTFPERTEGESAKDFNQRLLSYYNSQGFNFRTVTEMHASPLGTRNMYKEQLPKGVRGISAPRSSSAAVPR